MSKSSRCRAGCGELLADVDGDPAKVAKICHTAQVVKGEV